MHNIPAHSSKLVLEFISIHTSDIRTIYIIDTMRNTSSEQHSLTPLVVSKHINTIVGSFTFKNRIIVYICIMECIYNETVKVICAFPDMLFFNCVSLNLITSNCIMHFNIVILLLADGMQ